jgi:hypothetical protein
MGSTGRDVRPPDAASDHTGDLRPATVCRGLLAALEASEGRRKRRLRDTTPDALGLALKRRLLERAIEDDPAPEAFEAWLLSETLAAHDAGVGSMRAMALEVLREWQLAEASGSFRAWLRAGAPSDDVTGDRAGPPVPPALPSDPA